MVLESMRPGPLAVVFVVCLCLGCSKQPTLVSIGHPEYPDEARIDGIQGTVEVQIEIGVDGKVTFANGSGKHYVLIRAAEDNARQWVFGSFPAKSEFPMYRWVTYVFRLEGHPTEVATEPPGVKTDLPDRIEIIATPVHPDEWIFTPSSGKLRSQ
jgi:TonB family protein